MRLQLVRELDEPVADSGRDPGHGLLAQIPFTEAGTTRSDSGSIVFSSGSTSESSSRRSTWVGCARA